MKAVSYIFAASLLATSFGAQAAITITIQEVGGDVVVSGAGYLDIQTESPFEAGVSADNDVLDPSNYKIQVGSNTKALDYFIFQPQGEGDLGVQPSFGAGVEVQQPTNNTGDPFGISFPFPAAITIGVATDYISGNPINFSATFADETLASLGIDLASSRWGWGQNDEGEYVLLNVIPRAAIPVAATPVPTLGAFSLMGLAGAIGAAGVAMNRRRKQ